MSRIGSKPKAAFTLVELLIAVAILSIGLIGILRAYAVLINGLRAAKYGVETALLAKEKIIDLEKSALENKGFTAGASAGKFETESAVFGWELLVDALELDAAKLEDKPKGSLSRVILNVYTETNIKPPRKLTLATYVENIE